MHQSPAHTKLLIIKTIHTLIWIVLSATVLYVLWSGVSGRITVWSWASVGLIVAEGGVLLLFKGSCPLTVVARKYSASRQANFDIFLPNLIAKYNKQLFGGLFVIGLALMLYRVLAQVD